MLMMSMGYRRGRWRHLHAYMTECLHAPAHVSILAHARKHYTRPSGWTDGLGASAPTHMHMCSPSPQTENTGLTPSSNLLHLQGTWPSPAGASAAHRRSGGNQSARRSRLPTLSPHQSTRPRTHAYSPSSARPPSRLPPCPMPACPPRRRSRGNTSRP
jgi:hypothetical protein